MIHIWFGDSYTNPEINKALNKQNKNTTYHPVPEPVPETPVHISYTFAPSMSDNIYDNPDPTLDYSKFILVSYGGDTYYALTADNTDVVNIYQKYHKSDTGDYYTYIYNTYTPHSSIIVNPDSDTGYITTEYINNDLSDKTLSSYPLFLNTIPAVEVSDFIKTYIQGEVKYFNTYNKYQRKRNPWQIKKTEDNRYNKYVITAYRSVPSEQTLTYARDYTELSQHIYDHTSFFYIMPNESTFRIYDTYSMIYHCKSEETGRITFCLDKSGNILPIRIRQHQEYNDMARFAGRVHHDWLQNKIKNYTVADAKRIIYNFIYYDPIARIKNFKIFPINPNDFLAKPYFLKKK